MKILDPGSVFFLPYIISSFLISLIWLRLSKNTPFKLAFSYFFSPSIWFKKTTFVDLQFCILHSFLIRLFISPIELGIFYATLRQMYWLASLAPLKLALIAPVFVEGILATLVSMIAIDFASYLVHRCMHSNPLLWEIHRVHHSAKSLTLLSIHRQHPIEPLLLNSARSFAAALGLGMLHWIFPRQTPVIEFAGMGLGFFLYMFSANLHHSQTPVSYARWMRIFLISPHQHLLHHSRDVNHHGRNFGIIFSTWDRLFKTYLDKELALNELHFGLEESDANYQTLWSGIYFPIKKIALRLTDSPAIALARTLFFF